MKLFRKEEGFTLVELMVVVLIIGILVAIAIPVFNAAKANAQEKSCYANQRTIEGSCQTYNADNGVLPSTVATMVPTFIKVNPTCPKTTAGYHITAGTVDGDSGTAAAGWSTANGAAHTHF
jgi:prepilin-type N-terminal cleavage/methylation domain-containing protein